MCRPSRKTIAISVLVSGREVVTRTWFLRPVMKMVAGGLAPRSITRVSSHLSVFRANGSSWYQPWLATVLRKLKVLGVGILSSIWAGIVSTRELVLFAFGQAAP